MIIKKVFLRFQYKISELEKANTSIKIDLRKYEIKYNLSSEDFYNKFEDEDDFMI